MCSMIKAQRKPVHDPSPLASGQASACGVSLPYASLICVTDNIKERNSEEIYQTLSIFIMSLTQITVILMHSLVYIRRT